MAPIELNYHTVENERERIEVTVDTLGKTGTPQKPPSDHYSWKRPKLLIDTDLESDNDPKKKSEREFWDKQNIFDVSFSYPYFQISKRDEGEGERLDQELGELGINFNQDQNEIGSMENDGVFEMESSDKSKFELYNLIYRFL